MFKESLNFFKFFPSGAPVAFEIAAAGAFF